MSTLQYHTMFQVFSNVGFAMNGLQHCITDIMMNYSGKRVKSDYRDKCWKMEVIQKVLLWLLSLFQPLGIWFFKKN